MGLLLVLFGCAKHNPGAPFSQLAPETFLANVPADFAGADSGSVWHDGHRTFPVAWSGTDRDGFVVAYFWAVDDTSTWTRVDATVNQDTIVFAAPVPDTIMNHVFYVRAMDNDSLLDPTPAHRVFRTRNQMPSARITKFAALAPDQQREQSFFCLPETTSTWSGIQVEFGSSDPDSIYPPEFSWKWDNGNWSPWSGETKKTFTGADDPALQQPTPGLHTLYLRARDDAMAIDSIPYANPDTATITDTLTVLIIPPTLDQGILMIDVEAHPTNRLRGTEAESDQYYDGLLRDAGYSDFTRWEKTTQGFPPDSVLGKYKIAFYYADTRYEGYDQGLHDDWEKLGRYLAVGGKAWVAGWSLLTRYSIIGDRVGYPYELYEFPAKYLGLHSARVMSTAEKKKYDFLGANGVPGSGVPDLGVESAKVKVETGADTTGGISLIAVVEVDTARAVDTTHTYISFYQDTIYDYQGKACASRYAGPTFKTVYTGFPLYAMEPYESVVLYTKMVLDWLSE